MIQEEDPSVIVVHKTKKNRIRQLSKTHQSIDLTNAAVALKGKTVHGSIDVEVDAKNGETIEHRGRNKLASNSELIVFKGTRPKSHGRASRKGKRKLGPSGHGDLVRSIKPNHMADLDKALDENAHQPDDKQSALAQIQTLKCKD